ncbi:MAG: hypothetical protein V2A58_04300 [Planctomycetota bacterium]
MDATTIVREGLCVFDGSLFADIWENVTDARRLSSLHNPEWVSIDIRGSSFMIQSVVIWHEYVDVPSIVPVPAALLLGVAGVSLAGFGAALRRRSPTPRTR